MKPLLILAILAQAFIYVPSAKIIMTSPQIRSHIIEQMSLAVELVSRGHQLYIAVGSRFPSRASIEELGVRILTYRIPDDVLYGVSEEFEITVVNTVFQEGVDTFELVRQLIAGNTYRDCAFMMEDVGFLEEVRRLDFDMAIVEPFILSPCTMILPKYLDIPFVSMTPYLVPWLVRLPDLPSFHYISDATDSSVLTRLKNFCTYVFFGDVLNKIVPEDLTLLNRYLPGLQSWDDLLRQSELFLTEVDHHLDSAVPAMPNFVSVAGLTTRNAEALPGNLKKVVEKSTAGVIYLSFGSITHYLPNDVIVKFLEAFSRLNQTILVKLFISDGLKVSDNVKVFSWLPQNDVLGQPQTKLFITHCGNNGQHEALYHGVPMIGFPLFAEQLENCNRGLSKGFGLVMDILQFSSDELFSNIQEVVHNPKYRTTIRKASEIFRDQPMHPRERGAFWVEHVIKHGGSHLRHLAMDMPLYQFLMLDILGFLCVVACVFYILFTRLYNIAADCTAVVEMKSSSK